MVKIAESDADILKCREVLTELRPHLKQEFFSEVVRQTLADNRMLIFIEEEGKAVSASVFEWGFNLYRGKYIYIDDLTTLPQTRGKGYASQLLDWIIKYAEENNFDQVHLDSGVNAGRFDGHRLYHNKRFNVTSLHFALNVKWTVWNCLNCFRKKGGNRESLFMAGYSGKPLAQKLGIKPGMKLLFVNSPENYLQLLGDLPQDSKQVKDKTASVDFAHLFVKKISEMEKFLPSLVKRLEQNGMIWISWYKKSSGISTDVTEDLIRATAFPLGLVDVKVCAIDEQWSGLKLVIRKENRK